MNANELRDGDIIRITATEGYYITPVEVTVDFVDDEGFIFLEDSYTDHEDCVFRVVDDATDTWEFVRRPESEADEKTAVAERMDARDLAPGDTIKVTYSELGEIEPKVFTVWKVDFDGDIWTNEEYTYVDKEDGAVVKDRILYNGEFEWELVEKSSVTSAVDEITPASLNFTETKPKDAVNHPSHYTTGKFETIELIEAITVGYDDGYIAYCVGNAVKYLGRAPFKHATPTEDLNKAKKYLEFCD